MKTPLFITAFLLIFSFCSAAIVDNYPPLTAEEKNAFYQEINNILNQQRMNIVKMEKDSYLMMNRPAMRIQFRRMSGDLRAKEVIASNFTGNEKIRSPKVRAALLQLLRTTPMSESDMLYFQRLVDQENSLPPPVQEEIFPLFEEPTP
jgi:hypothetical protein